ncbi:MAG: hypothetical protein U0441_34530 [Polyangiaceae bacterium]
MAVARDSLATVAAVALHAAVFALGLRFSSRSPSFVEETPSPAGVADIELDVRDDDPRPPPKPPETPHAQAGSVDVHDRGVAPSLPSLPPPSVEPPPQASATAPGTAAPAAGTASPPPGEYGATGVVPMAGSGPFGAAAWTIAGALPSGADAPDASPTAQPGPIGPRKTAVSEDVKARTDALVRDPITVHDRELGLGNPGGTAISNSVAEAVRASSLPGESGGVLVVMVGGDGAVTSVSVSHFTGGDSNGWSAVASAAAAALKGKKLGLSGLGPKGAIVKVEVRSSVTYPSGSRDRGQLGLPGLFDGPPRDVMPAPAPGGDDACTAPTNGINPLCGVGMVIARGDVSDFFTKKHRNVRASFNVQVLDKPVRSDAPPAEKAPPPAEKPASSAAAPR